VGPSGVINRAKTCGKIREGLRAGRSKVQQGKQKVDTVEVAGRKKESRGKPVEVSQ
jgi:hypothetical protein